MAQLGWLLARDGWHDRDPRWPKRLVHHPIAAFVAVAFASTALWANVGPPTGGAAAARPPHAIAVLEIPPSLVPYPAPAGQRDDPPPIAAEEPPPSSDLQIVVEPLQVVEPTEPVELPDSGASMEAVEMPEPVEPPEPVALPQAVEPPPPSLIEMVDDRLRRLESRLQSSDGERRRLAGELAKLQAEAARRKREFIERERTIADLVAGQSVALGRLVEQTAASIQVISKLVARTGIDPERLIAAVRSDEGTGGPYVQLIDDPHGGAPADEPFVGPMQRLEALRSALAALPLEAPLVEFSIRGRYGVRRDPFTGQAAMHAGLDLVAPLRTAVRATAAGTVTIAGSQGDYGYLVEIDHGYGIRTRYAHLARIDVAVGDHVGVRDHVGLLGNTGRSTGAHLHYEVRFEDDALDPMPFIAAKRHFARGGLLRSASRN